MLLVFRLGERRYAVRLNAVDRVVRAVEITPLPGAPKAVTGVINVSGRITPVLDLRRPFGLPDKPMALTDQLIIAHLPHRPLALWVDSVDGVIDYPESKVVQTHAVLAGIEEVEGMVKLEQGIVFIEDLDRLSARLAGPLEADNG